MSALQQRLNDDLAAALKAKDEPTKTVLRGLLASVKNAQIASGGELGDAEVTAVLAKELKQREESAAAYASRPELVAGEQAEADIIRRYLPEPLTEEELGALVDETIAATGATSPADIGQVMGALKPKLAGRADSGAAAALVKEKLASA